MVIVAWSSSMSFICRPNPIRFEERFRRLCFRDRFVWTGLQKKFSSNFSIELLNWTELKKSSVDLVSKTMDSECLYRGEQGRHRTYLFRLPWFNNCNQSSFKPSNREHLFGIFSTHANKELLNNINYTLLFAHYFINSFVFLYSCNLESCPLTLKKNLTVNFTCWASSLAELSHGALTTSDKLWAPGPRVKTVSDQWTCVLNCILRDKLRMACRH